MSSRPLALQVPMSQPANSISLRRLARARLVLLSALVAAPFFSTSADAQALAARETASESVRPAVASASGGRFASGERASYELRLAGRGVGTGSLEVLGQEQVNGHNTL